MRNKLLTIPLVGVIAAAIAFVPNTKASSVEQDAFAGVKYNTHVQNIGWTDLVYDGNISGTTGRSLRVEALTINSTNSNVIIQYRTHVQNIGWTDAVSNGNISGTTGQSLRVEAIKIAVQGLQDGYVLQYRAHVQNIGWQDWVTANSSLDVSSNYAGTTGQSLRVEAIQVRVVETEAHKAAVARAAAEAREEAERAAIAKAAAEAKAQADLKELTDKVANSKTEVANLAKDAKVTKSYNSDEIDTIVEVAEDTIDTVSTGKTSLDEATKTAIEQAVIDAESAMEVLPTDALIDATTLQATISDINAMLDEYATHTAPEYATNADAIANKISDARDAIDEIVADDTKTDKEKNSELEELALETEEELANLLSDAEIALNTYKVTAINAVETEVNAKKDSYDYLNSEETLNKILEDVTEEINNISSSEDLAADKALVDTAKDAALAKVAAVKNDNDKAALENAQAKANKMLNKFINEFTKDGEDNVVVEGTPIATTVKEVIDNAYAAIANETVTANVPTVETAQEDLIKTAVDTYLKDELDKYATAAGNNGKCLTDEQVNDAKDAVGNTTEVADKIVAYLAAVENSTSVDRRDLDPVVARHYATLDTYLDDLLSYTADVEDDLETEDVNEYVKGNRTRLIEAIGSAKKAIIDEEEAQLAIVAEAENKDAALDAAIAAIDEVAETEIAKVAAIPTTIQEQAADLRQTKDNAIAALRQLAIDEGLVTDAAEFDAIAADIEHNDTVIYLAVKAINDEENKEDIAGIQTAKEATIVAAALAKAKTEAIDAVKAYALAKLALEEEVSTVYSAAGTTAINNIVIAATEDGTIQAATKRVSVNEEDTDSVEYAEAKAKADIDAVLTKAQEASAADVVLVNAKTEAIENLKNLTIENELATDETVETFATTEDTVLYTAIAAINTASTTDAVTEVKTTQINLINAAGLENAKTNAKNTITSLYESEVLNGQVIKIADATLVPAVVDNPETEEDETAAAYYISPNKNTEEIGKYIEKIDAAAIDAVKAEIDVQDSIADVKNVLASAQEDVFNKTKTYVVSLVNELKGYSIAGESNIKGKWLTTSAYKTAMEAINVAQNEAELIAAYENAKLNLRNVEISE